MTINLYQISMDTIEEKKTCLNCGADCTGRYCPQCGQPTGTPKRITMKSFWKRAAMSFASMTPGFWNTFAGLLLHPWVVIREYLHGRRVCYSPPVTMVMQLLLYFSFLYTILGQLFGVDLLGKHGDVKSLMGGNWLLAFIFSSNVVCKVLVCGVMAFNCHLIYHRRCHARYNFAEYLTAAIYMGCCFSIYSSLLSKPLELVSYEASVFCKLGVNVVIGTLALFRAFPIRSWWRRWMYWLCFMALNVAWLMVPIVIVAVQARRGAL